MNARSAQLKWVQALLLVGAGVLGCGWGPAALAIDTPPAVEHVLHISVDGLGGVYLRDYLDSTPESYPNFMRLRNEGASTFEARCDYFNSVTMPNHTSMLTGRPLSQPAGWPDTAAHGITFDSDNGGTVHDSGNPDAPYKASTLDVVHDRGLSTAFFASKTKFAFFVRSYDAVHAAPDGVDPDNGTNKIDFAMLNAGDSAALVDVLAAALTNAPWSYMFLHFTDPDSAGHNYNWGSPEYADAVGHVDQQLGRLLAAIDANPALSNRIAVVLTADHGGGGSSPDSHSTATRYANYAIPFFVRGPGIPAGANLYDLFANRGDPGTNRPDYNAPVQPLRNGDSGNLALALLGLPPIPGSSLQPVFGVPPVALAIEPAADGPAVTWPVNTNGFGLETASVLGPVPDWHPVTDGILTNDGRHRFAPPGPPEPALRFFRLRRP